MSEKRKPIAKIVAEIQGKRTRIEVFNASLWPNKFPVCKRSQFRIRMNGKWADGTWTLSEVFRQVRSFICRKVNKIRYQRISHENR